MDLRHWREQAWSIVQLGSVVGVDRAIGKVWESPNGTFLIIINEIAIALCAALTTFLVFGYAVTRPRVTIEWLQFRQVVTGRPLVPETPVGIEAHFKHSGKSLLAWAVRRRLRRNGLKIDVSLGPVSAIVPLRELRSSPACVVANEHVIVTLPGADVERGELVWIDLSLVAGLVPTDMQTDATAQLTSPDIKPWILRWCFPVDSSVDGFLVSRRT